MFLTKKQLRKIRVMIGIYCFLGISCLIIYAISACLQIGGSEILAILGIVCLILTFFIRAIGRYSEGKGKLINTGNKLIFQELRPAEFIKLYEEKKNCPDNVISKPDFDILKMLVTAYDALGENDKAIQSLDQMILIANKKEKPLAKLLKASILYSTEKTDEANLLYNEVQCEQMDLMTKSTLDVILKTDRAIALGDYSTAEMFNKQLLDRTFPKNTPLSILYSHFNLAKIYNMTERFDEAKPHLDYCIKNGGETGIKLEATDMLNNLIQK